MIPVDIGPHPDAPEHHIPLGKPPSWEDQDCQTLFVRRVGATGDILYEPAVRIVRSQLPSGDEVYPAYMSEWQPTEDDIKQLIAGSPIRLLVSGAGMPPVALWVRQENEV